MINNNGLHGFDGFSYLQVNKILLICELRRLGTLEHKQFTGKK